MPNITPLFFMLFPAPSFPKKAKAEMGQESGMWNLTLFPEYSQHSEPITQPLPIPTPPNLYNH